MRTARTARTPLASGDDHANRSVGQWSPDPHLLVDASSGRILASNEAANRFWGQTRVLSGSSADDLLPGWRATQGDGRWAGTTEDANGRSIDVAVASQAVPDHAARLVLSVHETTAPTPQDARARELLDIVKILPDVVFSCYKAPDGKIYWTLNEGQLAQEFHVTTEEIQGKPLEELFPGGASDLIRTEFERGFAGQPREFVNEMGGRFFRHYPQAVYGADGRVERLVGFISDVTNLRKAQDEIKALNAELETRVAELDAANAELEAFTYSVTHDLRTPLTVFDNLLQAMRIKYGSRLDDKGREHLEKLRNSSLRMGRLISDLLTLTRAGRQEFHPQRVDLTAMALEAVAELRSRDPGRRVDVHIEPAMDVRADEGFLHVAVANLIGNAWKYTAEKDNAHIHVGRRGSNGETAYYVSDNGVGFDMSKAGSLFRPFQRLHDAKRFQGTGVGLATVARIVQRHGGRVWADAAPDRGATFYFTLPEKSP